MKALVFIICLFFIPRDAEAQQWPVKMTSACYGLRSPFLKASCPRGKHIVVRNVFANAKPRYTNCPEETQEDVPVDPNCCVCTPDDCLMEYSGVSKMMYYTECNGKQSCNPRVSWQPMNTCPHRNYLLRSNYMVMEYYCVDGVGVMGDNDTAILDNRIDRIQQPRLVKADSLSNSTLQRSAVGSTNRTSATIPPTTNTPTTSTTTTTIPPTTKNTPKITTKTMQTTTFRTTTSAPLTTTTIPSTTTNNPLTTTTTTQTTTTPITTIRSQTTTTTPQTTTTPPTTTTTPQTTTLSLIIIPINSRTSPPVKIPSQAISFPHQLGSATNKPRLRTRKPQPITTTVKSNLTATTPATRLHLSLLPTERSDKAGTSTTISFRASLKQKSTAATSNGHSFSENVTSASNIDFASAKCIVTTECHTSIIINIIDAGQCPFKMLIRNLKGDSWSLCDINNNGFDTFSNVLLIYGNDSGVDVEFGNPWLQFISSDHFTDVFLLCNKMNSVNESIKDCFTPVTKATSPAGDYAAYPGLKNWEVALIAVGVLFILTFSSLCMWTMYSRRKKNRDRRCRFSLPVPQRMEPRPQQRLQTPTIVRIPDTGAGVNIETSPRRNCGERSMLPTIVSIERVNPGGTARPQLPPILHRPRFTS